MTLDERVQVVEQRIGQCVHQVVLARGVVAGRGLAHAGGGGQFGDKEVSFGQADNLRRRGERQTRARQAGSCLGCTRSGRNRSVHTARHASLEGTRAQHIHGPSFTH